MNRQAIIERVKIKLDELTPVSEGLDHPIDKYIDPCLDDAARRVAETVNIARFRAEKHTATSKFEEPCVTIPLKAGEKDNIARIINVKLSDWDHPVSEITPEDSPLAWMQKDPVTRGGTKKPVVVLRHTEGERYLDCYSGTAMSTHEVKCVTYKKPEELHDDLIAPLVIQCALLVAQTLERDKAMSILREELKAYL